MALLVCLINFYSFSSTIEHFSSSRKRIKAFPAFFYSFLSLLFVCTRKNSYCWRVKENFSNCTQTWQPPKEFPFFFSLQPPLYPLFAFMKASMRRKKSYGITIYYIFFILLASFNCVNFEPSYIAFVHVDGGLKMPVPYHSFHHSVEKKKLRNKKITPAIELCVHVSSLGTTHIIFYRKKCTLFSTLISIRLIFFSSRFYSSLSIFFILTMQDGYNGLKGFCLTFWLNIHTVLIFAILFYAIQHNIVDNQFTLI